MKKSLKRLGVEDLLEFSSDVMQCVIMVIEERLIESLRMNEGISFRDRKISRAQRERATQSTNKEHTTLL